MLSDKPKKISQNIEGASIDNAAPAIAGTFPPWIRTFLTRYLEIIFVVTVAIMIFVIFYFFPYKIAFLNFFYLPILLAAYFLGKRKAATGSVLCILLVMYCVLFYPDWFAIESGKLNIILLVSTWGCFLVITSIMIGTIQEKLNIGFEETRHLYEELKRSRVAEDMKEKVEKTLYTTMDPVVAKLATQGKLRFEKREISIMFTDLTGFTTYSDQNLPDKVLEELNAFIGLVEPIIEMYRGHIDKYMGDGIMVEFGAPIDYDQHALMAVLAGLKMQEALQKANLPWRLRVGIATGHTIIGMFGAKRQAYSALGDKVNVAKRLEEICEPDSVYIDEKTYMSVKPFVHTRKLHNMGYGRHNDQGFLERLSNLEEQLANQKENAGILYEIGKIYFELRDASNAIHYFEQALALEPDSTEIRLAYADANLKKDEFEKIQLKGKSYKINVYEVTGIINRWYIPEIIPPSLSAKYKAIEKYIEVPEDLILSIESLDASIGHGFFVGALSYAIADKMNLDDNLKKTILQAGYMQAIGKEAVPHNILNRPGSLMENEMKLLEKYVNESVSTLKRLGYVNEQILDIVKHQHEFWNGGGYPDGLKGEEIPVGARITSIAGAYSGLTSWRPYHEPWDARLALSEIWKHVEKGYYDPDIANVLFDIIKFDS